MKDKIIKKKRIQKIGTLVVVVMFAAMLNIPMTAVADPDTVELVLGSKIVIIDSNSDDDNSIFAVSHENEVELFRIQEDGKSGFGDTGPDATLEIVESGTTPFMISNGASGDGDFMIVDTSGNVGIGVAAPINKLDVEGAAVIGATYSGTNTAPTNGLLVEGNVGIGTTSPTAKAHIIQTAAADAFRVDDQASDTTSFVIDQSGNVGIGVSPSAKLHIAGDVAFGQGLELTISGGVVTVTHSYQRIDTQSDAGTDDLDTISGGIEGQILIIRNSHAARNVVVRDMAGNLLLAGDFTMTNTMDTLTLLYSGANWLEISRSDNT